MDILVPSLITYQQEAAPRKEWDSFRVFPSDLFWIFFWIYYGMKLTANAPENGWLEYTFTHFLLGWPIFRGELLVLGSVAREKKTRKNTSKFFGFEKLLESTQPLVFGNFCKPDIGTTYIFAIFFRVNLSSDSSGRKKTDVFFSKAGRS